MGYVPKGAVELDHKLDTHGVCGGGGPGERRLTELVFPRTNIGATAGVADRDDAHHHRNHAARNNALRPPRLPPPHRAPAHHRARQLHLYAHQGGRHDDDEARARGGAGAELPHDVVCEPERAPDAGERAALRAGHHGAAAAAAERDADDRGRARAARARAQGRVRRRCVHPSLPSLPPLPLLFHHRRACAPVDCDAILMRPPVRCSCQAPARSGTRRSSSTWCVLPSACPSLALTHAHAVDRTSPAPKHAGELRSCVSSSVTSAVLN